LTPGTHYDYVITAKNTLGADGSTVGFDTLAAGAGVPAFTVYCDPSVVTVAQGGSGSSTCTVTSLNGFDADVTLSPSWTGTAPTGFSSNLSPGVVHPSPGAPATTLISVIADPVASLGSFTYHVMGASGSLPVHTSDVTFQINPSGATALTPTSLAITFDPATVDISTTPPGVATIRVTITPTLQDRVIIVYCSKDSPTGAPTQIASGATGPTGQFVVMSWIPPETGTYYFSAVFDGDTSYGSSRAESNPTFLTAVPEFPSWISPIILVLTLISLMMILRKHNSMLRKH
jgi:hypothetical protein